MNQTKLDELIKEFTNQTVSDLDEQCELWIYNR